MSYSTVNVLNLTLYVLTVNVLVNSEISYKCRTTLLVQFRLKLKLFNKILRCLKHMCGLMVVFKKYVGKRVSQCLFVSVCVTV